MSSANVELVASLYEHYARGELDAMLERVDPDLEFDLSDRLPDEAVLRGREAYRDFLERNLQTWAEFRADVEELRDAGDAVVVFVRATGIGRESGVTVEERVAHVVWFRDGRPRRVKVFQDRRRALEAVGLGG
jgi:ketosteroid isomerase-like protein